jgi:hypothetical protein
VPLRRRSSPCGPPHRRCPVLPFQLQHTPHPPLIVQDPLGVSLTAVNLAFGKDKRRYWCHLLSSAHRSSRPSGGGGTCPTQMWCCHGPSCEDNISVWSSEGRCRSHHGSAPHELSLRRAAPVRAPHRTWLRCGHVSWASPVAFGPGRPGRCPMFSSGQSMPPWSCRLGHHDDFDQRSKFSFQFRFHFQISFKLILNFQNS